MGFLQVAAVRSWTWLGAGPGSRAFCRGGSPDRSSAGPRGCRASRPPSAAPYGSARQSCSKGDPVCSEHRDTEDHAVSKGEQRAKSEAAADRTEFRVGRSTAYRLNTAYGLNTAICSRPSGDSHLS
jgi:hypothetical protein